MRLAVRLAVVGSLSVAVVVAGAGLATAKSVSNQKYAKALCGAYDDYATAKQTYDSAAAAAPTDAAGYLAAVQAAAADLTKQLDALGTRLGKVAPDVNDGKKISKLFVKNMNQISTNVSKALEALAAADPAAPTFSTAQADYEAALTSLDTDTTDPFGKLQDQSVIRALDREKTCDDVVTVVRD